MNTAGQPLIFDQIRADFVGQKNWLEKPAKNSTFSPFVVAGKFFLCKTTVLRTYTLMQINIDRLVLGVADF